MLIINILCSFIITYTIAFKYLNTATLRLTHIDSNESIVENITQLNFMKAATILIINERAMPV